MKGKVVPSQELSDISIESTSLQFKFRGIRPSPLTLRWDDQPRPCTFGVVVRLSRAMSTPSDSEIGASTLCPSYSINETFIVRQIVSILFTTISVAIQVEDRAKKRTFR